MNVYQSFGGYGGEQEPSVAFGLSPAPTIEGCYLFPLTLNITVTLFFPHVRFTIYFMVHIYNEPLPSALLGINTTGKTTRLGHFHECKAKGFS